MSTFPDLPDETRVLLPCPACGIPTDRLKQFQLIRWSVFLGHFHWHQVEHYRACPPCMRWRIWYRCLLNIPTAHIGWPFLVLPGSIYNLIRAGLPDHTPEILEGITPDHLDASLGKNQELSLGRVMAITGALTCWLPAFGLVFAGLAWLLNRTQPDWRRPVSGISLIISLLIHMLIAGLLLAEAIAKM